MDLFSGINYLAILVAVISVMLLGSLYYSPFLFGKLWIKLIHIKQEEIKGVVLGHLLSTIGFIISAFILAIFFKLLGISGTIHGLIYGALICLGFVAPTMLLSVAYGNKPFALFFLDLGNMLLSYSAMGVIISTWK